MTRDKYWNRKAVTPRAAIFRIEGDNVTISQIAERIGVTRSVAESRLKHLRGASGAITWLRLRSFGKAAA